MRWRSKIDDIRGQPMATMTRECLKKSISRYSLEKPVVGWADDQTWPDGE